MAEEAKSIPWLKVFIDVGLSGVWGKVTSRVEIGTKYHIGVRKQVAHKLQMQKMSHLMIIPNNYRTRILSIETQ